VEEEGDDAVGAREMDPSLLMRRGKTLDGKVGATLSWSSSPTKGGGNDGDDEMEDKQEYLPTSPLSKGSRSPSPLLYRGIWKGGSEVGYEGQSHGGPDGRTRAAQYLDDETNDITVESNCDREPPDMYMGKRTLHTASSSLATSVTALTAVENSEKKEDSDLDDDCDTIWDAESDTEMAVEPQDNYNHQGRDNTEDSCTGYRGNGYDGGFFTLEMRRSDLGNRTTLAALTGGPRKALWFPTEPLARADIF